MTRPTVNDVQAVEPILTNMMVSYLQADDRFVASRVFPTVTVANDSGTYYIITKKYFFLDSLQTRAPGENFRSLDYGLETSTYATKQWAGDYPLADEIVANNLSGLDLAQAAIRRLSQASLLRKEVQWAADFMTTGVWGTDDTTATNWDDFSAGNPVGDILTAKQTISNNTGYDANTMVVGYVVHAALANHPDLIDRIKYTQAATATTMESAVGDALGIANYLVAKGVYSNTNEASAFSATNIVDDDALVCHVDPSAGIMGATAGKTFVWPGGGGAGTIYRYRDDARHATVIQHKEQWDQVAVATDLGYFFSDIV